MAHEFLKITEKIETDIRNGTYNDTLPSIAALSQIFDVCPATIKRILSILRDRDLVSGEHGRCVRVNPKAAGNPFFHKNIVFLSDIYNMSTPFYSETLQLLTEKLFKRYVSVHLFVSENQIRECNFTPDCVLVVNNSGNIMLDILLQKFPGCKVLLLNQHSVRFPYIMTDNKSAGYNTIRYLAEECGHTDIGILATQLQYPNGCFSQRYAGALEYAQKHPHIKLFMTEIPELELEAASTFDLVSEIMQKNPQITAIFATCDVMALGVYCYAAQNNLKIPEDLAVIGFDNHSFGNTLSPQLTSMSENVKDTVSLICLHIFNLLMNKEIPHESFTEPYLVIKSSTSKDSIFSNNIGDIKI